MSAVRCARCCQRVEIEVWPAQTELHFRDDRGVNPIDAQIRFEAAVLNGRSAGVKWDVFDPAGHAGAGSIDATGRYLAPVKGGLSSGYTDVVVASAIDDPLRRAFAWVTLVGDGPAVKPDAQITIQPKRTSLYYPLNDTAADRNQFIDVSNTMQMFRTSVRHSSASVEWLVDGVLKANLAPSELFRYQVTGSGSTAVVVIAARLAGHPSVIDQAKVVQINYRWP